MIMCSRGRLIAVEEDYVAVVDDYVAVPDAYNAGRIFKWKR